MDKIVSHFFNGTMQKNNQKGIISYTKCNIKFQHILQND